ncbi:DNA mismatch repair protein MutS2 [Pullulanibacillus pueri]|uniref:Endonuclease MutS2 n=1 Tax=Pullulanibacillus pueri TaxID=1437324 RepID=A0A8J2ZWY0_9BACL|nr:endonuclease MutS2 [Pullulanibacillus pueri]MBM7682008.1 DNA mismatch repair protein MutS2 [Pullulanibacillus pueri]GGH83736.1 endonuclease MutS2 [Pullulanibacillus pueri]
MQRALSLLEYGKIKEQLKNHTASSLGKDWVEQLEPKTLLEEVKHLIDETDEGVNVYRLRGNIPFGGLTEVRPFIKRATIGSMLSPSELNAIGDSIRTSRLMKKFFAELEEEEVALPILQERVAYIDPPGTLEREITSCIDDSGRVMDGASDKLRTVRAQIRTLDARIKEKLESMIRSSNTQKMLSESIVTIRNDRYVIPVKQEYRHSFGGIVHDQSSSGATVFIEPQAVVDIDNQLSEARAKEKHEIERILMALTEQVAEVADLLIANVEQLGYLDFIFAKAKFSHALKATKPALRDDGQLEFKKARHPLIAPKDVVPINVHMGKDYQAIIITGPNTGGKTVTLKTVGLLTLMAQSGLHIPVDEGSTVNVFEDIFADIGDEQSIEQSLSTFSSHMTNIVNILDQVNFRSLVLFDELGAGTDPQEGAALSIAILDYVFRRGASIIATTHYSELKAYAYEREGAINASVEFDVQTLRPTYRLLMGVPGRSNAFEISRRLGLQDEIIEEAKQQISGETAKVDEMIAALEKSQREAEAAEQKAKRYEHDIERLKDELEAERIKLENERSKILQKAEETARESVDKARKDAAEIIATLRRFQAQPQNVKEHEIIDAKKRLDQALDSLSNESKPVTQSYKKKESIAFEPGQEVKVISFGQKGHIIEKISDKEYLVQVGIMKMNIAATNLKAVKAEKEVKPVVNVRASNTTVKTELDLRGERFEDAIYRLDKYIDKALVAGYSRVSIIHGKGTGVLRKGVENHLKHHSRVKGYRSGGAGEGGGGVTIVELK